MKSMSGYSQVSIGDSRLSISVETRAYNGRYLEIRTKLPDSLADLEGEVQDIVRKKVKRGKITLAIRVEGSDSEEPRLRINRKALHSYFEQLSEISAALGLESSVKMESLLSLPGVIEDLPTDDSLSGEIRGKVRKAVQKAVANLDEMRVKEGEKLRAVLAKRIEVLRKLVLRISRRTPKILAAYYRKLRRNVRYLLKDSSVNLSEDDVRREIALLADKCDISEEVDRVLCHLDHFLDIMHGGGDVGKKLDFLTQEIFREANTMAQKAGDAATSRAVVMMKAEIEKIREQLQNIE